MRMVTTRTRFLGAAASGLALLLAAGTGAPPERDAAEALHFDAIVIDTHSDTTPKFQDPSWDFTERHEAGHQDLPRMREGGLDAQFWSIYMGRTRRERAQAVREALRADRRRVRDRAARHPDDVGARRRVGRRRSAEGVADGSARRA